MTDEADGAPAVGMKQSLATLLITQNLRHWLVLSWAFAVAFSAGWRYAVIWGAAACLASIIRGEFEQRLARGEVRRPAMTLTAIATVNSLLWCAAPMLAWNAGQPWSQAIAVCMALAGILLVFTQFGNMVRQAMIAAAPYALAIGWFAFHLARPAEFWTFAMCICVLNGALFANTLYRRVNRLQMLDYQARQAALIEELRIARDSANAANAAKSAFLAMISHELRTPMNGVLGAAQLLDSASLQPGQKRYVEMIRTSGDSLLSLLNDVLDFAKIESGRVELESIAFDLPALTERIGALWSAKAEEKGLDYAVEIDADAPVQVIGDPTRLSQIIHNLLSNATKFTDHGRVGLTVNARRLGARRARITLAVADTGIGIAAEDRARLFQPFSQLDSSSTRRFGGTGLGLAISRRLTSMLGGELALASEPGKGAVFTMTLDVDVAEWTKVAVADGVAAPAPSAMRPMRVLVAEDHAINRQILALWLESEGHDHACAEDGQAALDLCATQAFDLILMDVNMPVMDGLSAVRALRATAGANRATPVVMLSASARAEDHAAGLAAGANAYLSKPIDFPALRATLARMAAEPDTAARSAAAWGPRAEARWSSLFLGIFGVLSRAAGRSSDNPARMCRDPPQSCRNPWTGLSVYAYVARILQFSSERPGRGHMSCTPDWLHGGEPEPKPTETGGVTVLGAIAWIAGLVITADLLFVAQRFWS